MFCLPLLSPPCGRNFLTVHQYGWESHVTDVNFKLNRLESLILTLNQACDVDVCPFLKVFGKRARCAGLITEAISAPPQQNFVFAARDFESLEWMVDRTFVFTRSITHDQPAARVRAGELDG